LRGVRLTKGELAPWGKKGGIKVQHIEEKEALKLSSVQATICSIQYGGGGRGRNRKRFKSFRKKKISYKFQKEIRADRHP